MRREATDGGLEPKAASAHSSLAAQRTAASPRRCPDGDEMGGGGWRPRVKAAQAHSCPAGPLSSAQMLAAPLYRGRRRREATDERLESKAAPAHSCLAPPLPRRRQRWEVTDGGPESRGGTSAQLSGRAAVQAATGTRGDRRPPRAERWRQHIAALPRRCPVGDAARGDRRAPRVDRRRQRIAAWLCCCPSGGRDERRGLDGSSRGAAPAHSCLAEPLSSA